MRITQYNTKINKENKLTELVKEISVTYATENKRFTCPERIAEMMNAIYNMDTKGEEYLYMLSLNSKNDLIGVFEISHGTVNASLAGAREIGVRLLLSGATNFVLVHNHPSGDPSPSSEDIRVTKRLKEVGDLIGVTLLDHIIIGDTYKSLKEMGLH